MNNYFVYILCNHSRTLYIGVTNNLERRLLEHRSGLISGFTKKYKINQLIWYEEHSSIEQAIAREKELKGWRREKKIKLIIQTNPEFLDLYVNAT